MNLSYLGFTQEAGVRRFRFECQIHSKQVAALPRKSVHFVVSADMSLFLRYSIPIQDGPAICRGIVVAATAEIPESELVSTSYPVDEMQMASFAASRIADAQTKSVRRNRPPIPQK
jgi:hypothetical protein